MSNLIVKKFSANPLKLNESSEASSEKKYVFEGIFTPIGVKNRNERIYDEEEVLKHLAYLREKIKKEGGILGELDHPEGRFEIFLKDVSHRITDLWYDPQQKCVMGRLELLDTENGRKMKAIVDAGCPLYVSSRAAGTVGADSHVSIQQIFTYDIVATPGFEQCKLDAVTESEKVIVKDFINESQNAKKATNQATKYGVLEEGIDIIETNEIPKLNETKNFNIDMTNLTQPLVNEDIKVKVSPEKAQELGLNLNGGSEDTASTEDNQGDGGEQLSKDDILDIIPTYAEQDKSTIKDIQPEFKSADDGSQNTDGESETDGSNQSDNPFMMESAKTPKKESKQDKYSEKKDIDECGDTSECDCKGKKCAKNKKDIDEDINIMSNNSDSGNGNTSSTKANLSLIPEGEKTPNPVADGKRGSDTDKVQHSSDTKEKKDEKTMKNDDSETVEKLQNKKKDVKESTQSSLDYYRSLLEEQKVKTQIKQTILDRFPFSVSLSESNFNKFATLSEADKMTCANYIFENQIWDVRQINEQFMRPLFDRINEQKNYLRLADKSDIELYNNAPRELRESIDKQAELYILESKADVDEFWSRTGIRDYAKNQVQNETFVQNFNEKMAMSEDDSIYSQFGYDQNFINWVGSRM